MTHDLASFGDAARPLALLVSGCGASDGDYRESADAQPDVDTLLEQTFSDDKRIDSGKLDLAVRLDVTGTPADGPITMDLSGPFQARGDGPPAFELDAAVEGLGQSFEAGLTSTGEKLFVRYDGIDYAATGDTLDQFKTAYREGAMRRRDGNGLTSLGIDPRAWLTDATIVGEATVGDADTIKITAGVDESRLLDDVDLALQRVSALGLQGAVRVPAQLSETDKRNAIATIKDPQVEIYTGKDDHTLRKLSLNMVLKDSASNASARVAIDLAISEINQAQQISAPAGARPLDDLVAQLGASGGVTP